MGSFSRMLNFRGLVWPLFQHCVCLIRNKQSEHFSSEKSPAGAEFCYSSSRVETSAGHGASQLLFVIGVRASSASPWSFKSATSLQWVHFTSDSHWDPLLGKVCWDFCVWIKTQMLYEGTKRLQKYEQETVKKRLSLEKWKKPII